MEKYMMALDQGTTSSRCILFNKAGEIVSVAQKEFRQIYPKPGWVEHDPLEIWTTQMSVAIEAMGKAEVTAENIAGIAISAITSSKTRPSFAIKDGFVVTPQITPISLAFLISSTFAVSIKNFIDFSLLE